MDHLEEFYQCHLTQYFCLGLAGDLKKAMKDGKPIIIEVLFYYSLDHFPVCIVSIILLKGGNVQCACYLLGSWAVSFPSPFPLPCRHLMQVFHCAEQLVVIPKMDQSD